jgi:xylulokinase
VQISSVVSRLLFLPNDLAQHGISGTINQGEQDGGLIEMLIGIDVGTTSVKAALFDDDGTSLKSFSKRYATTRPAPGHVEQNPQDWMTLVLAALTELVDGLPQGSIAAVGLCSQVNTHVFVDENGKALMPAMTWADGRCATEAARLDAQITEAQKLKWWGAPLPIDASHILSRMAYVAKHHSDIWKKTRWVMAPKDYCLLQLTGQAVTDPMTSFGVIDGTLSLVPRLLDLVPGAEQRLPALAPFTKIIGAIRSVLPCAGVPMVTGAMDAWSGLLGAGVSEEGQGLYLSGTSEILGIVSSQKAPTPGVIAFPKCECITLHAGPTQSGGASVEWLSRLLGKTAVEISNLAAATDTTQPLPMFLPHLEGERAPLWDANSRASFAGLSSSMCAAELCRAVLEGVGYSARLVMESLEASACLRPVEINHAGGGAGSDIWCQIRADILGRPMKRMQTRDAGVLGAALTAGTGVGLFPSLNSAAKTFVKVERVFEPNPREQARHDEAFAQYQLLYQQLRPFNAKRHTP